MKQYTNVVFFDVGGVLKEHFGDGFAEKLVKEGRYLDKRRFDAMIRCDGVFVKPAGSLEELLLTKFPDLGISAGEMHDFYKVLPKIEESWDVARELKAKGYAVGIISDQIAEIAFYWRSRQEFTGLFAPIIISSEVGYTKKSKKIFEIARERVGKCLSPQSFLLIDDTQANLDTARKAGWKGMLYTWPESLRARVSRYGLL